jgi:hypothetical protein
MRIDNKFGRIIFIASAALFTVGLVLLVCGIEGGLFPLFIGGFIFFRIHFRTRGL